MLDKLKEAFTHPSTQKERSELSGHHDDRDEVSGPLAEHHLSPFTHSSRHLLQVDALQAQHAKDEALADQRIRQFPEP